MIHMKKADKIVISKAIFTGCAKKAEPGMVAVRGNRIVYSGPADKLEDFKGADTEIFDMGDKLVIPGFHDAHLHFYMSALYASPYVAVSMADTSEEQCVASLAETAKLVPKNRWLIGAGWYHPLWDKPVLPTKKSLDRVYPDRPVVMISQDCHTYWLNSAGLKRLGLDRNCTAPVENGYERDADGELTGVIHEGAAIALNSQIYDFTPEEENRFYQDFLKVLNSYGITSVCDVSMMYLPGADFIRDDIYARLLKKEKLTARIHMYPTLREDLGRPLEMMDKYQGEILRCQGTKAFFDGVSPCHTAYLKEPYANAFFEGDCGHPTIPEEEMRKLVLNAHRRDMPVRIHAIGDQAIHRLLDFFEEAQSLYGKKPYLHHTLEHMENWQVEDIGRIARLGIIPSVQPPHVMIDTVGVERDLGYQRSRDMWPFRRLLDAGAELAFGTDSPVVEINPFLGLYNAVTRQSAYTREPKGGWLPKEKITVEEALRAYTYGAACAAGREHELGTLTRGMLADMTVLDKNILEEEPDAILETRAVLTIMDGRVK